MMHCKDKYGLDVKMGDGMCWLWRHVVWLYNVMHVKDGRTAYERLTGRTTGWGSSVASFGSGVLGKIERKHKLSPMWEKGMYLGVVGKEHLVATDTGLLRTTEVKALPKDIEITREFPTYRSVRDSRGQDRETKRIPTAGCKGCEDRRYHHSVACIKRNMAVVTPSMEGVDDPVDAVDGIQEKKEEAEVSPPPGLSLPEASGESKERSADPPSEEKQVPPAETKTEEKKAADSSDEESAKKKNETKERVPPKTVKDSAVKLKAPKKTLPAIQPIAIMKTPANRPSDGRARVGGHGG